MSRQSHVPVDPRHFSQSGHPDHEFEGASSPSRGSNRPKRPSGTTALRTAIACRACRDRKTRCSGDQPSCRYCSKAGIACEYASGSVAVPSAPALPSRSLDEWGDKILQAVDSLAQGLQRSDAYSPSRAQQRVQGRDRDPITPIIVDQLAGIDNVLEEDQVPFDAELHHRSKRRRISDSQRDNASYNSRSPVPLQGPTRITSSLSILSWPALFRSEDLATYSHKITSARATLCLQRNSDTQALTSASCETSDLLNLLSCFAESILPTIPVIDLGQVRRMISRMDEYGVPWNGEACLVLLVAALGSIYQPDAQDSRRRTRDTSQISSPASSRTRTSGTSERITSTTLRYWNMARKRLSWAMNTAGRLSTQCQLLAGLYLVHSSEPLAAWKMLTSALISLDDQQTSGLPSDIAKIETERRFDQQIRMAILTLLCRLRFEIELPFAPGSVQLSSEDHFPNQTEQENGSLIITSQTQADILRIRGNASVNSQLFHPDSSIADLQYLQTKITSLLSALEEWRTRLPFAVKLDSDTSVEHRDSHLDIHHVNVRKQMQDLYYETKELILRPSLYLVLHSHHLHGVQAMAPGEGGESRTFEDLLATHLTTQLQDMVAHHRLLLLERTRLFLGASQRGPRSRLPEVGWLKHQTCFTLALLLIASSRVQCDCGGSLGMGLAGINDAVGQVIDFLTHDDLGSEESRIAADILRKHHGASDGST